MVINGSYWSVNEVNEYSQGYKAGIRYGDKVIKIDGVDPGSYDTVQKWGELERASNLVIYRNNKLKLIEIHNPTFKYIFLEEAPMLLLGITFWLIGLVTWYKKPFLLQVRAFYLLNYFIGLAIILAPASSRIILISRELEYFSFAIISPLLVNFISLFSSERNYRINKFIINFLFLITFFVFLLLIFKMSGFRTIFEVRKIVLLMILVGTFVAFLNILLLIFKVSIAKDKKNQLILILIGLSLGVLPFILSTALPIIILNKPFLSSKISSLFIVFMPLTWSYVFVNTFLPDGRDILNSIFKKIVAIIPILVTIPYLLKLLLLNKLNIQEYITITLIVMIGVFFYDLNKIILGRTLPNSGVYNVKNFKYKINEISKHLKFNDDNIAINKLVEEFEIEGVLIIAHDNLGWEVVKVNGFSEVQVSKIEKLYSLAKNYKDIEILYNENIPVEVVLPYHFDDLCCTVFLGHRISKVKFKNHELPFLNMIFFQIIDRIRTTKSKQKLLINLEQMSNLYKNSIRGLSGLKIINKLILNNFEEERKYIAREIHDGPLQIGLEINRKLKRTLTHCSEELEVYNVISATQKLVDDLNYDLRSICSVMRPSIINDLGLLPAVEALCNEIMKNEYLVVSLTTKGLNRQFRFNEEIELGVYRCVQEALNNIIKHAETSKVNINISLVNSAIELKIKDYGIGFDIDKIKDWEISGDHFGIIGMRERIKALEGEFIISSVLGEGVVIKAIIPIKK